MNIVVGIDVGKTNLRVRTFTQNLEEFDRWSRPSTEPALALEQLSDYLTQLKTIHDVQAAGISTFGPVNVDRQSSTYGSIYKSSDALWTGLNFPHRVGTALRKPVYFDYDVNAGALAEKVLGSAIDLGRFIYLSIGTGIGAASFPSTFSSGQSPQFGHMYLPRESDDLSFRGSCRFHGACFQGLASGRAIEERWGISGEDLPKDHPAWDLEARYLARASANLIYSFLPESILVASSVARAPRLIARANDYVATFLNGFLDPGTEERYNLRPPIVRAQLAPDSSIFGAAIMARDHIGLLYE